MAKCVSNESWEHSTFKVDIKNTIDFGKKTAKIWFSKKILFFFLKKKILNEQFSKKFYATPKFFYSTCSKHLKKNLYEGVTQLTLLQRK